MRAATFYARYGFIALPDSGRMFLPMRTIRALGQGMMSWLQGPSKA